MDLSEVAMDGMTVEERLARIEHLLEEVRRWMYTVQRPVADLDERFERTHARIEDLQQRQARMLERIVALETRERMRSWLIGVLAGSGSGVVIWVLGQLMR